MVSVPYASTLWYQYSGKQLKVLQKTENTPPPCFGMRTVKNSGGSGVGYGGEGVGVTEVMADSPMAAAILDFFEPEIAPLDPPSPKTPPQNQTWSGSDDRLRRYDHLKFFQDNGGRHLGFFKTGNSAIRSALPENPTLEPNMEWIERPVAEIWPFEIFEMRGRSSVGRSSVAGRRSPVGRSSIYTYFH